MQTKRYKEAGNRFGNKNKSTNSAICFVFQQANRVIHSLASSQAERRTRSTNRIDIVAVIIMFGVCATAAGRTDLERI